MTPPSTPECRSGPSLEIYLEREYGRMGDAQRGRKKRTSTLQCTTPRRPYVMHGVSSAIHVELLRAPRVSQSHYVLHGDEGPHTLQ